jgi:general secretion pathway protein G
MFNFKTTKGFTLIELLAVIAIIGILSSIVALNTTNAKKGSRDARRAADIRSLSVALDAYYSDYDQYPRTLATLVPKYIATEPKDPQTNNQFYYTAMTSTSFGSTDCTNVRVVKYHLGAAMENSENSGNLDLKQDHDWPGVANTSGYAACNGSTGYNADFHGKAITVATQPCVGAVCGGAVSCSVDRCFDMSR